jgi:hypothetical protein
MDLQPNAERSPFTGSDRSKGVTEEISDKKFR